MPSAEPIQVENHPEWPWGNLHARCRALVERQSSTVHLKHLGLPTALIPSYKQHSQFVPVKQS